VLKGADYVAPNIH